MYTWSGDGTFITLILGVVLQVRRVSECPVALSAIDGTGVRVAREVIPRVSALGRSTMRSRINGRQASCLSGSRFEQRARLCRFASVELQERTG